MPAEYTMVPCRPMKNGLALLLLACACGSSVSAWHPGQPLQLKVSEVFPAGTALRDHYTGAALLVDAAGLVTLHPDAGGVVLLEKDGSQPAPFTWQNATVYFALTDRFQNGDPSNDGSYGRTKDGAQEVGTWHGGDFKGLTSKLDYIAGLGATAIWISPVVEQVHGWVGGGSGDFKHYGYHGYWALDFTRLDANYGTFAELQALVDQAHARGLRVLLDVVLNHPGYATGDDLVQYLPEVFKDGTGAQFQAFTPSGAQTWTSWNDLVDYKNSFWQNWWSPKWIRAGLGPSGMFQPGGTDELTRSVGFLPDFKTESSVQVDSPLFFSRKGIVADSTGTVRDNLVKWQTDWVRKLGIDGFRCDTAKNVDLATWSALKTAAVQALKDWKSTHAHLDEAAFWMTAEVFPHGVFKDAYFTAGGFDAVLNFDFQPALTALLQTSKTLGDGAVDLEGLYQGAAAAISFDPAFDVLNYLSSHDTALFFDRMKNDPELQRQAGSALLLAPGGAQIFYGDESGRKLGPGLSDPVQGTRSDMNWSTSDATILEHWQKLGTFRKNHAAVGGGAHAMLKSPAGTYAFSRKLAGDAVVVVLAGAK